MPSLRLRLVYERLRGSLLTVPLILVASGFGLAMATVEIDRAISRSGNAFAFTGGPQSARDVLSAIASTMLSFTGLVFSVTIVTLQLTSSQFSPRAMRNFLRDAVSQAALGVFLATFVYALTVLREVRGSDGLVDQFVPGIAVSTAFALVGLSVVLFVVYIHHVAQSIRAVNIIGRIAAETRRSVDRVLPHEIDDERDGDRTEGASLQVVGGRVVTAPRTGVVQLIDGRALVRVAAGRDVAVAVLVGVGDFVPEGAPLLRLTPEPDGADPARLDRALRRAVVIGDERTMEGDPAFGLRQLVDIAERALSPGVNDPTTAVQCVDHIHALLRRIATRLAFDEIRHWGASSLRIRGQLRRVLDDLAGMTCLDRQFPVTEQLRLLDLLPPPGDP